VAVLVAVLVLVLVFVAVTAVVFVIHGETPCRGLVVLVEVVGHLVVVHGFPFLVSGSCVGFLCRGRSEKVWSISVNVTLMIYHNIPAMSRKMENSPSRRIRGAPGG
jgi:hypothetical protein